MENLLKRTVSFAVACVMVFCILPMAGVFAIEGEYEVGVLYDSDLGAVEVSTGQSNANLEAVTDWSVNSSTPTKAGSVYIDDNNLNVSSVFNTTLKSAKYNINGVNYTHYIQIRLDSAPASSDLAEKAGSTALVIKANKSGTLTYAYRRQIANGEYNSGDGKDLKISKKNADGTYTPMTGKITVFSDDGSFGLCNQSIELTAGDEYIMWAVGTTGTLCGMNFNEKQIYNAKPGDMVTVKSTPNNNAWIGNISLDDSDISLNINSDYTECSFVMPEKNVDVSVDFINKSVQNETDGITFNMIKGVNTTENNITDDLDLISGFGFSIGYADVAWESSIPDVISISGDVNTDKDNHDVKMTAVCTFQDYPNLRITKDFNLKVPADTDDKGAVAVAKEALNIGDTSMVKSNIELPAKGRRGTTITWISSNPNVVSADGVVNRQKGTDSKVVLTATISRGEAKDTKEIEVFVPGYTAVEISRVAISNAEGRVVMSPMDGGYVSHIVYTDSISEADRTGEETLIVAVYDKSNDGALTACKLFNLKETTEKAGEETILYLNPEDVPVDSNSEIKVFAFESTNSVEPLMKSPYTYGQTVANNATIFVAGDSTACNYKTSGEKNDFPRTGWAQVLGNFFTDGVTVKNLALSGRSSLSFRSDANYKTIINGMKPGDYFIIQFGHNDEKSEADRHTDYKGDRFTDGSYKNSLYEYYVKPALEKGAYPLITTSISRNKLSDAGHEAYVNAAKDLAQELGLPYIDLYAKTNKYINDVGTEKSKDIFAFINNNDSRFVKGTSLPESFKNSLGKSTIDQIGDFANSQYKSGGSDNTHIQYYGAQMISQWWCDEIETIGHPLTGKRSIHVMTIEDLLPFAGANK